LRKRRRPSHRLVKIHRSYSVDEVSRLCGVHKNTVRQWFRTGLVPIDLSRPVVVLGHELHRYLKQRRADRKVSCGPGRIYCLPCRSPKVPDGNFAELVKDTESLASLQAICPDCGRMIYRRVNPQRLTAVRGNLEIAVTERKAAKR
jgi:hypothetical protein